MILRKTCLTFLVFIFPVLGNADDNASQRANKDRSGDRASAMETLQESTKIYEQIVLRAPEGKVPTSIQNNAKCIAIFPKVITAAVVVGGTHGNGVVTCNNNGSWSTPAFYDISGASFGAQLGGKSTDLVLFINNTEVIDRLRRGKFKIGTDASVAIGKYSATAETTPQGVVAYQRNEGGYVGASLTGGTVSLDVDSNRSVYGSEVESASLIDGIKPPTTLAGSSSLIKMLPNA